jgi:hypothetical protein
MHFRFAIYLNRSGDLRTVVCLYTKNSRVGVSSISTLVRERGVEPPHLAALAPQTSVSTIPPLARACDVTGLH